MWVIPVSCWMVTEGDVEGDDDGKNWDLSDPKESEDLKWKFWSDAVVLLTLDVGDILPI